ncbi:MULTISPECIES: hypothetical protein [Paenibacillus]|uniref:Uncharacterized protein n=1 Tax=Paenibacillus naphthalenovorans TaxID=162209 RepID=A0A0U2WEU0_9BACL|nr:MULTISPECIES: hypothetical protein [Paenibacillus]ALS23850.1 hypothetical protein IJ22_35120 [Paenibacillus naphthalenovorans]NTZ16306.1 hypothetical protein [Paenibacillus sp. JMULE4]GCL72081.1 hypothetical protein PN4B1_19860 [Paenibacillus naphthalenovorans]SDI97654.1 hypothetical protein SAMN05421868_11437 [Paenibacillus naphthalenovorans]
MLNRFPAVIRNVNEGLDEVISALDKMSSIYQSAEQMSPVLKKIARLINESQAAAGKPLKLNGTRNGRSSVSAGRKRKRQTSRRPKTKRWM